MTEGFFTGFLTNFLLLPDDSALLSESELLLEAVDEVAELAEDSEITKIEVMVDFENLRYFS